MVALHSFILKPLILLGLASPVDRQDSRHKQLITLLQKTNLNKKTRILDIGSGNGNLLKNLRKAGFVNLSGCDINRRKQYDDSFEYFQIDLNDEFFKHNKKYKLIICSQVIEHLYNPHNALKVINNLLEDGGYAIISYPNCENLFMRFSFLIEGVFPRYKPQIGGKYTGHINILPENLFEYLCYNLFEKIARIPNIPIWHRHWLKFLPRNRLFEFQSIFLLRKK